MKQGIVRLALALALAAAVAPLATGRRGRVAGAPPPAVHGGGHTPPQPSGPPPPPPPYYGPGDTNRGGRPGTPGPGAPGTPGPSAPGPSAPRAPSLPAPSTPLSGGGQDETAWDLWWRFNQHDLLALKDAVWTPGTESGTDDEFFLGHGGSGRAPGSLRPSAQQLAERIVPALIAVLKREGQPEVLSGCLMALAKIGDVPAAAGPAAPGAETSGELIASFLSDSNQQMSETAALALGVLGQPRAMSDLSGLVADDERGRRLCGEAKVPARTRAFAAYGLGLLARANENRDVRRFAAHQLARTLAADDTGSHDLGVACVNALGLIGLPSVPEHLAEDSGALPPGTSREAMLRFLLERFVDRELKERVRAHLPRAMAAQTDPFDGSDGALMARAAAAGAILRALEHGRTEREVVYGCVIALGQLGNAGDGELDLRIRRGLLRVGAGGDTMAANLALIAQARVGSRPGPGGAMAGAEEVAASLLASLARGKSRVRPWAALALGLHGHGLRRLGLTPSADATAALRSAFGECRSAEDVGAYALALGLCGDVASAPRVIERLYEFSDDRARGPIALALGLFGDYDAIGHLQRHLPEAAYRPDLLRPAAIALALLGDKTLVGELARKIEETDSSARKAVYAWALAHVGDARAVDPILAMLADEELPDLARGIAALAAGFIAERERLPWNAALSIDVNYPASPASLFAPTGGGVLDIR